MAKERLYKVFIKWVKLSQLSEAKLMFLVG